VVWQRVMAVKMLSRLVTALGRTVCAAVGGPCMETCHEQRSKVAQKLKSFTGIYPIFKLEAMAQTSNTPMTIGVPFSETAVFSPIISPRLADRMTSSPPHRQGHPADHLDGERFQVWRRGNPQEAARCADLFKKHREQLDGIVVTLRTSATSAPLRKRSAWPILVFPS